MRDQFRTVLVSDDLLFKRISDLITESNLNVSLTHFKDYTQLSDSGIKEFNISIIEFDSLNSTREILSLHSEKDSSAPLVFIYRDTELNSIDYRDLIINGAFGLVPKSNLESLIQHILRLQSPGSLPGRHDSLLMDELFESYFNSSDSLVSIINSDLKYESANDSFSKFHNLENRDLKGLCPSELWGEEVFKDKIEDNLRKCLSGQVVKYKAYFNKTDSPGRCYEVVYRPILPKGSSKALTLVETRDVTHLEESMSKALEIQDRNYYYEKYLPFGIFECDTEGNIRSANETFYRILEIPSDSIDKVNLNDYSESETRFTGYLKTVHEGESSTFSQLNMHTNSGTEIFARISSHTRTDNKGSLVVNAILEDNTREVLLEKKLSQSHRIETLGTLAGGIAHDFNTILTTISGYSELAMDEVGSESVVYDYMTRLINSVNRAESIVSQMLTFSRQIEVEMVAVKVEDVVSEVCDFMQSALSFNISIERDFDKIEGHAEADPTQLFRVFLNIMTNSMHAMEDKGGTLSVNIVESISGEKKHANICISDTGSGIDKAIIDRIYEPFFTTKTSGEGTGMGLAVAYGIISRMGGEISVDSEIGKGTSFTVSIPLYENEDLPGDIGESSAKNKAILYIDNDVHFSRTVLVALERLGYNVRIVTNPKTVEKSVVGSDFTDFVFIRCNLEEKSKKKMIESIIKHNPASKIILITKPGSSAYRKILKTDRERISILNEPVTLREIVNSIKTIF